MCAWTILYLDGSGAISGAEISLLTLAANLDPNRYEPVVAVPWEGSFVTRLRDQGITTVIMEIRPLTLISLNPLKMAWSALRALPFVLSLARFIRENEIALIHVNSYRIGIPCSAAAWLAGVPVVWHIRDIATSKLKRWSVALLADKLTHRTIAISNGVAATLRTKSAKTIVIYNGVASVRLASPEAGREVREELDIALEAPLIGNIGQFVPWKGQNILIEAMAKVAIPIPKLRLLLVGYHVPTVWEVPQEWMGYEGRLRALVVQLGLEGKVMFSGFREDLTFVMKALDIYVHSAVRPEPFGRVLVEAMAAGKAVIAPDAGGIPEIVEHGRTGLLFPPGNVEALAEAIVTLVCDKDKRDEMGRAGARVARRKFAVEEHARQVEGVYAQLLDDAP